MPRLPDREIAAATLLVKKIQDEIAAKLALIKGAQAQFDKFDKECKAAATMKEKLDVQIKAAEAAVKKAGTDKKALAAAQKFLDQLETARDGAIATHARFDKLRKLAQDAPDKANAALKKLQADLPNAQAALAAATKRKPEYDKAFDAAMKLRTDFLVYAKKVQVNATALAKAFAANKTDQKTIKAAKALKDDLTAELKPIREPAKMKLDPKDMADEMVPVTNQCFKLNTAILATLKGIA